MLNDRDGKYEGTEESEYHFSDDDVSYEVESEVEPAKPAVVPASGSSSLLGSLTGRRRIFISAAVFLVLVYIVYKMVMPTPLPSTVITPAAPPTTAMQSEAPKPVVNNTAPKPEALTPPAMTASERPIAIVETTPKPPASPTQGASSTLQSQPQTDVSVVQPQPASPIPVPGATVPVTAAAPSTNVAQPMNNAVPASPQVAITTSPPPPPPSAQAIPSGSGTLTVEAPTGRVGAPEASNLSAQDAKLLAQLQAEYITRINDFANENKNLQDQLETLANRVNTVEMELNQLVQALTRQTTTTAPAPREASSVTAAAPVERAATSNVAYNVQAIIPGRAWLRSDAGDTVTVAEGDVIKGLGKVTKIDPYDGVVEINIGNKVITLSYGAGG